MGWHSSFIRSVFQQRQFITPVPSSTVNRRKILKIRPKKGKEKSTPCYFVREREREWLCVCVCVNICNSNRKTGLVREGDFLNALSITCTHVAVLLQLLAPQCLPKTTFTARISLHYLMVQHDWEIHKHTQDILVYGKNPWRNTLFVAHIGTAQLPP